MIGQSSGLIDDLSPKQLKRLKALQKLQRQHVELEIQYHNEVAELERKYAALYKPLYDKVNTCNLHPCVTTIPTDTLSL